MPDPAESDATGTESTQVHVRWLGHSTVLVELPGLTVLTDPFLRRRLGPLRRHGRLPNPTALPIPDAVLISHGHPDHFDRWSIRRLPGEPLVVVPHGLGTLARRAVGRIHELRVGQSVDCHDWRIHAVPARHWRWPLAPRARSIGYLVEGPVTVYFAGDTGLFRGLDALAGRVDVALVPIGRWGPQPTPGHLTPETAAQLVATIRPRAVVPIHWGTLYPVGLHRVLPAALREPATQFLEATARLAPDTDVRVLEVGEATDIRVAR